jgi:hypothetical protein
MVRQEERGTVGKGGRLGEERKEGRETGSEKGRYVSSLLEPKFMLIGTDNIAILQGACWNL